MLMLSRAQQLRADLSNREFAPSLLLWDSARPLGLRLMGLTGLSSRHQHCQNFFQQAAHLTLDQSLAGCIPCLRAGVLVHSDFRLMGLAE